MKNFMLLISICMIILQSCGSEKQADVAKLSYGDMVEQLVSIAKPVLASYDFSQQKILKGGQEKSFDDLKEEIVASINANDDLRNSVKSVWTENNAIIVDSDSGMFAYMKKTPSSYSVDTSKLKQLFSSYSSKYSGKNILLVNQAFSIGQEKIPTLSILLKEIIKTAESNNIKLWVSEGDQVSINNLKTMFTKFDFIVYISHGKYINKKNYIETGEKFNYRKNSIFNSDIESKRMIGGVYIDEITREAMAAPFYFVNEEFFDTYYINNSIPNTVFYFLACELYKNNRNFGKVLVNKGASQVWGWNENTAISDIVAPFVVDLVVKGYDPTEIINILKSGKLTVWEDTPKGKNSIDIINPTVDPFTGAKLEVYHK